MESVVFMRAIEFTDEHKFIYLLYKVVRPAATFDPKFYDINIKQKEGKLRLMITIDLHDSYMTSTLK